MCQCLYTNVSLFCPCCSKHRLKSVLKVKLTVDSGASLCNKHFESNDSLAFTSNLKCLVYNKGSSESQTFPLVQLPQKMMLALKVVKISQKIIIWIDTLNSWYTMYLYLKGIWQCRWNRYYPFSLLQVHSKYPIQGFWIHVTALFTILKNEKGLSQYERYSQF